MKRLFLLLALLVWATVSGAATWHVEADGSGYTTILQVALDAAAEGDTILIGPGRYDDFFDAHAPGWTEPAVAWITKDNLTIIGAGPEETFLGAEEFYQPAGTHPKVICSVNDVQFVCRGVKIENAYQGIYWAHGSLQISDCAFSTCDIELYIFNEGGTLVENSTFETVSGYYKGVGSFYPARDILVNNCVFFGNGTAVQFGGTEGGVVTDSEFDGVGTGVAFTMSSSGSVTGCTISSEVGFQVSSGSSAYLFDNEVYGRLSALYVTSGSQVNGNNCAFSGGSIYGTLYISSASVVSLNGCHIFKEDNYAVILEYFSYEQIEQDLTGNYWGTTDVDSIAEWIWDGNDDPAIHSTVNYLPIADGPVPTENTTWSDVKTLFK